MNNKKQIVNLEYLREMLQICPKLPDQQFEEPPFEEEILTFLKDLGHSGEIKVITDVDVNKLHQPWRSFVVVINKCLSGKSTGYDSLRLSQAQILWGMYHKKNVDYAYLLWEDFVYQVENKNVKRSNEMYYPRFTKVVSRHEDTQLYGAILPDELTNEAIKYSESYKEYYAIALGAEPPKTKPSVKKKQVGSDKTKTPPTAKGKRLKTLAKAVKPTKKKQPTKTSKAKGLSVLSDVALTESEQMKLATKRSLIQTHNSHTINSGADEGTGGTPGVPDVPTYESDEEQISWKSSDKENDDDDNDDDEDNDDDDDNDDVDDDADNQDDEGQEGDEENDDDDNDNDEDNDDDDENDDVDDDADNQDDEGQDDDNKKTDLEKDGDEFVHPKFSTHDQEERQDEEDNEEEGLDLRVQTPSYYESTNDEESDEVTHGANVKGEELDEEETNEDDEANELYRDVNVNLEGRDIKMIDAPCTIVQTTQVIEDTHVIITPVNPEGQQQSSSVSSGLVFNILNPSLDTCIDSIFNLNTESTSLVYVLITTIAETALLSATTLPPLTIPFITHLQQTLVPTPATVPSSSLQDLPNFGSFFGFDHRLKTLENDFSEFKQTNQFTIVVSLIPSIVDTYLANKMNEAIKTVVQLQSDRLRDEAQVDNEEFINILNDNIKKIIKEQVKEQVKAQTSRAVAANLSELELKKILIDKMESNKSIYRSDEQKNLYKALVDAYESDKLILDIYGDTVSFKRRRDDEDKDEESSTGSNRGSKRRRAGKEPESTSTQKEKTSKTIGKSTKGPNLITNQPVDETIQHHDWFQKPTKPLTPDRDWNKTLPAAHGPIQPWISSLARKEDTRDSFNELMDTPLDFSAFVMNQLKVDTLTPELLAGLIFELMKGSCKSLVELEFFLEEVYKETTDQLDSNNPEGQQYLHDLRKPLPLIPNSQGRRVIPFDHFINNDLAYLRGGTSSRTYATSVTKNKAAYYGHVKWIEDLVPNIMWSPVSVIYDKYALWGISHWGQKRQSIIIQRRVEDLQLGFKSYQKKLNLTRPDTYISDLKRLPRYLAYPNPRGFIYQNKDKKNKLMRIDELHKFSDGTLNVVQTALDDILKRIEMKYLPQTY
ncbi:hypothetical protein Tco_0039377 [Tanacetum coccineum]